MFKATKTPGCMKTYNSFDALHKYLQWYSTLTAEQKIDEVKKMDLEDQKRHKKAKEKNQ